MDIKTSKRYYQENFVNFDENSIGFNFFGR